ncbi:MAG: YqgE/AlgH family protein [Pirellulaceae bacterium]
MTSKRILHSPKISLEGFLLVAAPHWESDIFRRAVCLIVHHDAEGAVGVLLNRSLKFDTQALWTHLAGKNPATLSTKSQPPTVHFGGPAAGPVVALHDQAELAEFSGGNGVYFAAQIQHLQQLLTSAGNSRMKIIVGQADWSAGQLDRDFWAGNWLPLPVTSNLVFCDGTEMWPRAMREIGNHYVATISGAHGQPGDLLSN